MLPYLALPRGCVAAGIDRAIHKQRRARKSRLLKVLGRRTQSIGYYSPGGNMDSEPWAALTLVVLPVPLASLDIVVAPGTSPCHSRRLLASLVLPWQQPSCWVFYCCFPSLHPKSRIRGQNDEHGGFLWCRRLPLMVPSTSMMLFSASYGPNPSY